ncbi:hypothetical protein UCRNP2_7568 [Neofusicoccum parvum UCRNP2]|uniref:Uncharacterized protein n=1 Tax=Botryosphaeria parva (strain UCR-NP2) TaxID=1287680 RepID=R1GI82_BOTPV|nr:hypothetical protein UCRNP2_7568 [Neofusicoccum parvum UCRNP2]
MYRNRNDPRLRRTLDELSHNIETANEAAQEGIYAFSHNYVHPCFASVSHCFEACAAPCFGSREDRLLRRRRGRGRARAEHYFDFYDDWEEEENDDPFGWGNSEFDRLLAGQGTSTQPGRQRAMSYGARCGDTRYPAGRRKTGIQEVPTLSELKFEEAQVQKEEEGDVERKRGAARTLAARRGLKVDEHMVCSLYIF